MVNDECFPALFVLMLSRFNGVSTKEQTPARPPALKPANEFEGAKNGKCTVLLAVCVSSPGFYWLYDLVIQCVAVDSYDSRADESRKSLTCAAVMAIASQCGQIVCAMRF